MVIKKRWHSGPEDVVYSHQPNLQEGMCEKIQIWSNGRNIWWSKLAASLSLCASFKLNSETCDGGPEWLWNPGASLLSSIQHIPSNTQHSFLLSRPYLKPVRPLSSMLKLRAKLYGWLFLLLHKAEDICVTAGSFPCCVSRSLTTWRACMSGADVGCWPGCSCRTSLSSLLEGNYGTSWPPAGPDGTTSGTNLKAEKAD